MGEGDNIESSPVRPINEESIKIARDQTTKHSTAKHYQPR